MERREVSSRSNGLIRRTASWLAATRVTPNQISVFSIVASLAVPVGLQWLGGAAGTVLALVGIQLRLLANVLDGLVAIEGGKSSALGALYNEFPDRIADTIVLVSLGLATGQPALGWACALLAALTAYVRVFGGALGLPQVFAGPLAKQHRMAVASVMLVALLVLPAAWADYAMLSGLWLIAIGSAWTCVRRTRGIAAALQAKDAA
jgi:phosphatidylglycerophosphate synthase